MCVSVCVCVCVRVPLPPSASLLRVIKCWMCVCVHSSMRSSQMFPVSTNVCGTHLARARAPTAAEHLETRIAPDQ